MTTPVENRKAALKALINILILESFVLLAVIGFYLFTNSMVFLIGGVVGTMLIFAPLLVRWALAQKNTLNAGSNGESEVK